VPNLTLPDSISDLRAQWIEALHNRVAQIDLSPLLVYDIANVPASVLPYLAWQFDVLSPLWGLLAPSGTDATSAQVALLQAAIPLHRTRGTPSSILTALATLGFADAILQEGQNSWGGTSWPANEGWAVCRIVIPVVEAPTAPVAWTPAGPWPAGAVVSYEGYIFVALAAVEAGLAPIYPDIDSVTDWAALTSEAPLVPWPWLIFNGSSVVGDQFATPTAAQLAQIIAAFEFFAPARCWLDGVWLQLPAITGDVVTISEYPVVIAISGVISGDFMTVADDGMSISVTLAPYVENLAWTPDFSRRWQYAGFTYADQPIGITDGAIVINQTRWEGNP
jgi:hypothetical protein